MQQRHLGKDTAGLTRLNQCKHGITGLVWCWAQRSGDVLPIGRL